MPHPFRSLRRKGWGTRLSKRERELLGIAGQFRLALGQKFAAKHGAFDRRDFRFLWVTDFPMFEWDETEGRWNAAHHPFTSPHEEDMGILESDPGAARSLAYDVVLNGTELGSGSIRIHRQDIQSIIFKALGMSPDEQQARFGYFLEALQYGTPPHGGIALGLDRIVMILAGATSLREVIPFPKTAKAIDLMMDAPTPVSDKQLKELGIAVVGGGRFVANMTEKSKQFSDFVAAKLSHYVYRLIDPRNGTTFYVGRGKGNRVFSHAAGLEKPVDVEEQEALKFRTIRAIKNSGFEVQHVIHRHGMDEDTAKEVEAALIDAYPGLTNIQGGYDGSRSAMHAEEVIREYEAPEADFRHNVILIIVNKSIETDEVFDAVRYAWKISPAKARNYDYVLAVRNGLIVGVYRALEWLPATPENFPGINRDGYGPREGRHGFRGREAPDDIKQQYLNKRVPDIYRKQGAANPIRYVTGS